MRSISNHPQLLRILDGSIPKFNWKRSCALSPDLHLLPPSQQHEGWDTLDPRHLEGGTLPRVLGASTVAMQNFRSYPLAGVVTTARQRPLP
jgi:hypothetical protein